MKAAWAWLAVLIALGAAATGAAGQPAQGRRGMVVTDQAAATRVGVAVLRAGGNAIDAAVAVGYALAVTDPCCGNIGGGGFMLIHRAGAGGDTVINFRERAPLRATPTMYLDARGAVIPGRSTAGWLAIGTPGTVAGLERARRVYGSLSRAELMAPAIALARDGFVLGPGDIDMLRLRTAGFAKQPNVAAIFTRHGVPLRAGDRLRQPQLAATLAEIAHEPGAFYRGSIAQRVVAASRAHGGILSLEDFRRYVAEEFAPVVCRYRGFTIISAPPPSSGGTTLCEILAIVNGFPLGTVGFNSAPVVHADVEAERLAYADRNTYLGDPDFVRNPVQRLLSPAYIAKQRARIPRSAGRSSAVHGGLGPPEHAQTTHYSIVDRSGNAVAVTYTINDDFGSGVVAGNTGFLLNNEMDDFTSKPGVANLYGLLQGNANAIAPGKRPLSSMAPTIVLHDGRLVGVIGSPGGSRIITIVLSVLQNLIDYHMNVQAAVTAPRFHHQWLPDIVETEPDALSTQTQTALRSLGYSFAQRSAWGVAEAIVIDGRGIRYGGSDPRRRSGLALGY